MRMKWLLYIISMLMITIQQGIKIRGEGNVGDGDKKIFKRMNARDRHQEYNRDSYGYYEETSTTDRNTLSTTESDSYNITGVSLVLKCGDTFINYTEGEIRQTVIRCLENDEGCLFAREGESKVGHIGICCGNRTFCYKVGLLNETEEIWILLGSDAKWCRQNFQSNRTGVWEYVHEGDKICPGHNLLLIVMIAVLLCASATLLILFVLLFLLVVHLYKLPHK